MISPRLIDLSEGTARRKGLFRHISPLKALENWLATICTTNSRRAPGSLGTIFVALLGDIE